jgi:hypothetical protein
MKLNWGMILSLIFCFAFWAFVIFSIRNCSMTSGCQTTILNQGGANEKTNNSSELRGVQTTPVSDQHP